MCKPKIRFKGCHGEWENSNLERFCVYTKVSNRERHLQNLLSLSYGKIVRKDIKSKKGLLPASFDTYQVVEKDVIVFRGTDLQNDKKSLRVGLSTEEGIVSPAYVCFKCKGRKILPEYLYRLLHYHDVVTKIFYQMGDGLRQTLSFKDLKELQIIVPTLPEQRQIAAYFRSLDGILSGCEARLSSLRRLKEGALQAFFPQQGETQPKIRFKGCQGEWERKKLGDIARKVSEKNTQCEYKETFTNSAEMGIISQLDYFDHDITNKANISSYYVVQSDDFVYNPRISVTAPVGPISRNKLGRCGIMSPLYTVFHFEKVDNGFMEYYFKTTVWHSFMYQEGNTGARNDRFSIKDSVFFTMPILLPPTLTEQHLIANFFRTLDRRIELERQRLEKLKRLKAACLEKMFV